MTELRTTIKEIDSKNMALETLESKITTISSDLEAGERKAWFLVIHCAPIAICAQYIITHLFLNNRKRSL